MLRATNIERIPATCASWILALLALLALVAFAFPARAQARDAASIDAVAIDAYRRGDLAAAKAEWSKLLEDRTLPAAERARLCFDLGNAAYREGKPLEAVGWYEASLRLRPRDADAWANVEHARGSAGLEPKDRGDLAATTHRLFFSQTRAESEWLAIAGILAWGVALAFEALRGGRAGRWAATIGLFVALAACAPWIARVATAEEEPMLVVETGKALVRSEPRTDAAVVAEVPAGTTVDRRDELFDWAKIELASGTTGWLPRAQLFALDR